ncbi:MAG TPA: sulfatase-like hydrolase/transferase [Thermoanaerobaculales bacterium]|nr:sulfatase-like hydrolase/transferase [Thermoanaerobaculales bacterium]HQN96022.1 sulfatase-like hydrolase/transferase [Thermoanaerobaculales bacterium]HQP43000.1 sulfatase-like hydrolase/transferase [Thermoanaerobaculales bacterium]
MSRRVVTTIAALAALAAIALVVWWLGRAGGTGASAGRRIEALRSALQSANVLLITLDTTRADRIGAYGWAAAETPRLDRLAREGALFEQTITPTAFTLPAHSSILTGLYPPFHGVRLNGGAALAEVQTTLAETLAGAGYRCGAVIGAFVIDQRWGLSQGFEHYDDSFKLAPDQRLDLAGVQRPADQVVDLGLEWLDQGDGRPFFAWLHLYDPHIPYDPPEPFKTRFSGRGASGLYDGEIAFTDSEVGRVLDWLDERGIAEETVVVVVGDHGEALGDHGETEHGYYIYDATVRVPLIVRAPGSGAEGVRVSQQVRTIDVMPTVLDLVGVAPPQPLHGQSLLPLILDPEGGEPRPAYSESMAVNLQYGWSALYGLRTATHKFIDAPRAELYDHAQDADEATNLVRDEPALAERLRAQLAALRAEIEAGAPATEAADLDQETLGMLAALGYVGGDSAAPTGANLADPKDKLHLFEAVGYASQLMLEDNWAESAEVLEKVLGQDPGVGQAKHMLATCYRKTGRTAEAKSLLDEYLREHPDSTPALITMAGILSEEGKHEEVVALAKRILAVDPKNAEAYALMAAAHMDEGDHAAALPLLEKAVEIQPKLTRNRLNLAVANINLGHLSEAENQLDVIVDERPKFPLAHFHLGLVYEEEGRLPEARAAYAEEVELFPNNMPARFNLGNVLLALGDAAGAERELQTLIEKTPESAKPYLLLARVLLQQGRELAEVERLARDGLARAEADDLKVLGYYILADVYSRQGRQAELERALRQAQVHRARLERPAG